MDTACSIYTGSCVRERKGGVIDDRQLEIKVDSLG